MDGRVLQLNADLPACAHRATSSCCAMGMRAYKQPTTSLTTFCASFRPSCRSMSLLRCKRKVSSAPRLFHCCLASLWSSKALAFAAAS